MGRGSMRATDLEAARHRAMSVLPDGDGLSEREIQAYEDGVDAALDALASIGAKEADRRIAYYENEDRAFRKFRKSSLPWRQG